MHLTVLLQVRFRKKMDAPIFEYARSTKCYKYGIVDRADAIVCKAVRECGQMPGHTFIEQITMEFSQRTI
jgi:hypothetical protein